MFYKSLTIYMSANFLISLCVCKQLLFSLFSFANNFSGFSSLPHPFQKKYNGLSLKQNRLPLQGRSSLVHLLYD